MGQVFIRFESFFFYATNDMNLRIILGFEVKIIKFNGWVALWKLINSYLVDILRNLLFNETIKQIGNCCYYNNLS